LQRQLRAARLAVVQAGLDHGGDSPARERAAENERLVTARVETETVALDEAAGKLRAENEGWRIEFETASGDTATLPLDGIVRAWQPNRLSLTGKLGVYLSRWGEFLGDDPREANSAGGVFPAIWGTVAMTLIMALLVAPFGVLAALYLREYASRGPVTAAVRVAINNLAGVPSIVYGAFGLGFFCYGLGAGIDELFFKASLVADSQPTFGTGGLLWASLTLALLTLPVVIVATEEALSAVPNSMREGSYACGAGKWQTIRRIVLPRALPGIMTGLILAMARGAGEVAPLMLVGVKKLALELPVDGSFPFVHPEREFMHLAYLIYDVGFQSPNSQAARPMVYTITFLLVAIIALLNVAAIWIRSRLRRRFVAQQF
jgi:phosphate transport system permease protein